MQRTTALEIIAYALMLLIVTAVVVVALGWVESAYGQEEKTAVIFLLDKACKPSLVEQYTERFENAWIVCTDYAEWKDARANLFGFEKYYTVIYITHDNQHPLANKGVKGEAWFRDGDNYAYSINNPVAIAHELSHLECECHFTPDGRHDSEREMYPSLWAQERGG